MSLFWPAALPKLRRLQGTFADSSNRPELTWTAAGCAKQIVLSYFFSSWLYKAHLHLVFLLPFMLENYSFEELKNLELFMCLLTARLFQWGLIMHFWSPFSKPHHKWEFRLFLPSMRASFHQGTFVKRVAISFEYISRMRCYYLNRTVTALSIVSTPVSVLIPL